jgi:cytochrome c-type biogenesis protein
MENVTLFTAFIAGVLSFISPCVLPLIPGYLSYISGVTLDEMRGTPSGGGAVAAAPVVVVNPRVMMTSVAFVLGFSLVFVSLGASATYLGQFMMERLTLLGRIAGVILVIFGLHMMGVFRIGWLYQEARIHTSSRPAGFLGAVVVGIAFAFGWTPCIGPILAGILAIAAAQDTVGKGIQLLAIYSAGLGIPFLLAGLAIDHFFTAFHRIRRHYRKIEIVSGALLVVIGMLIFTNRFTIIAQWLTPYLPVF